MSVTDVCWICLQEGDLHQPCSCPRQVHVDCLVLWQLHSAGTAEEHNCRFCSDLLPDWRTALGGGTHQEQVPVVAVMFEGKEWRLRVPPTPEGALRFQKQVELITGVPFNEQVSIKFHCKSPTGVDVSLCGVRCLEAAIHCAAMHCASQHPRSLGPQQQPQPSNALHRHNVVSSVKTEQQYVAGGTVLCSQAVPSENTQPQSTVLPANQTQNSSAALTLPDTSSSSAQNTNICAGRDKAVSAASLVEHLNEVTTHQSSIGSGSSSSCCCCGGSSSSSSSCPLACLRPKAGAAFLHEAHGRLWQRKLKLIAACCAGVFKKGPFIRGKAPGGRHHAGC